MENQYMSISLKFNKKELEFLSLYNLCCDTKAEISDKFKISGKKESTSIFFSFTNSNSLFMITELQNKKQDDLEFVFIFSLKEFSRMISLCSNDSEIVINNDGMFFGKGNNYKFESFEHLYSYYNEFEILDSIKNQNFRNMIDVKLNELKEIDFCMGEGRYNLFSVLKNPEDGSDYFVTSNGQSISGAIKNKQNIILNEEIKQCWIPVTFYNIVKQLKEDNISLVLQATQEVDNGYFFYKANNTIIIIPFIEHSIFDIFEKDKKKLYDHKYEISINKENLLPALKRISVITNNNFRNRIFLNIKVDSIELENKDGVSGKEIVVCNVDNNLLDKTIVLQSNILINAISNIDAQNIIIKMDSDVNNMAVITITSNDENKMNKFFILNLMENRT